MTERQRSDPDVLDGIVWAMIGGIIPEIALTLFGASVIRNAALDLLIGLVPGAVLIVVGTQLRQKSFGLGLIIGGCVIGLLGGACGAVLGSG